MNFVRINGVLLHYRLAGPVGAPELVFVNSLGTDARIWNDVIDALANDYRILSYDKRGHGLSDAPAGEYSLNDHLDDLQGLVDHVGFGDFALCGVSVGGLISMGMALRASERLRALVLCDTAPKIGDNGFWNTRLNTVLNEGLGAIADGIMQRWFSPHFHANQPDALAGWQNMFLRSDRVGYAATCATLRDADLSQDIGNISTPTLVVTGADDQATPVALVEACANAIPGARFEILPECGHIPSIEQPRKLAALMQQFFEEAKHG
jgi:3-oxoadipate enol-lactonase